MLGISVNDAQLRLPADYCLLLRRKNERYRTDYIFG